MTTTSAILLGIAVGAWIVILIVWVASPEKIGSPSTWTPKPGLLDDTVPSLVFTTDNHMVEVAANRVFIYDFRAKTWEELK